MFIKTLCTISIFALFTVVANAQEETVDSAVLESINKLTLVDEIPDLSINPNELFSIDVTPYFKDDNSDITLLASMPGNRPLPTWITFENGIVSGLYSQTITVPIEIKAISGGEELSDYFNVYVKAETNPMLTQLGTVHLGTAFDEGAAEISAYDPFFKRLFVTNAETNSIEIVDIRNPYMPLVISSIDVSTLGGNVNSVAFKNGFLAAAVEDTVKQEPGKVAVFNSYGMLLWYVTVGALPDMVTFNEDGTKILSANEGEPNSDYTIDPEGSVSVIDVFTQEVKTASFEKYNSEKDALIAEGARIFGHNATVAQDIEPEYITVKGNLAYVSLQENNAIAVVDIEAADVIDIHGLGYKDHSLEGNGLDASNKADYIDIRPWPIWGIYQPDAIASVKIDGEIYLITVNEGDARDYDGYSEEAEIGDLPLDSVSFPNRDELTKKVNLKKLNVTTGMADTTEDGAYKTLYSFGARSFSIWNSKTGELVYDSGDNIEQITSSLMQDHFNCADDDISAKDRSDNKGPEPEALTVGEINGRTYAFIGLERQGGIMVYDITNPAAPEFRDYVNNRNFDFDPVDEFELHGDNAPEGLIFIPANESPICQPMIVVSNEVSGTVTMFAVNEPELPMQVQSFTLVDIFAGKDVLTIDDGDVIDYAVIGNIFSNIRTNVDNNPSKVKMKLRGRMFANRVDRSAPYSLFFDCFGFQTGRYLPEGEYTLSAIPAVGRKYNKALEKTVSFSIVNSKSSLKSDIIASDEAIESKIGNETTVKLYPVPFSTELHLDLQSKDVHTVTVKIVSSLGSTILERKEKIGAGVLLTDLSKLPVGIYSVVIPELNYTSTVVKQ